MCAEQDETRESGGLVKCADKLLKRSSMTSNRIILQIVL